MAAPKLEWLNMFKVMFVVEHRTLLVKDEITPALLSALADGGIRSRRRQRLEGSNANKVSELAPAFWDGKVDLWPEPPEGESWGIDLHHGDLLEWLDPSKPGGSKRSRGRPTKWNWDSFWVEAAMLANTPDGLPEKQGEFEKHMADWFVTETGDCPSVSQIREKAGMLYQAKAEK